MNLTLQAIKLKQNGVILLSTGVFGIMVMKNDEASVQLKNKLSFDFAQLAIQNGIWINQGGNISERTKYYINKIRGKSDMEKVFEITDDPEDPNAQCLFSGDGVAITVTGLRVDSGESLYSRMARIQNFFITIFNSKEVEKIELFLNIESGDEFQIVEMKSADFCKNILDLYENENNWLPSVKIVLES